MVGFYSGLVASGSSFSLWLLTVCQGKAFYNLGLFRLDCIHQGLEIHDVVRHSTK